MLVSTLLLQLACAPSSPGDTALSYAGEPGLFELSFDHDGGRRSAVVFVPDSAGPGSPLLLNFHGFGGSAEAHVLTADLREMASREGLVLAYPQGSLLDGSSHWNAALPGPDNKSSAQDLDFAAALVDNIATQYGVDRERVYAAGYSNGAMLSYALACHGGGLVSAVVAVSGTFLNQDEGCSPASAVPLLLIHGTADTVLPYDGDGDTASVEDTLAFWVEVNQTSTTPEQSSAQDGATQIETLHFPNGRGGSVVTHHRVVGGGHDWFNLNLDGQPLEDTVWAFVSPHSQQTLR